MSHTDKKHRRVATYDDGFLAEFVRGHLESEGMEAIVKKEISRGGFLYKSSATSKTNNYDYHLFVLDNDYTEAMDLLRSSGQLPERRSFNVQAFERKLYWIFIALIVLVFGFYIYQDIWK